jgi:hypothetical protein
LVLDSTRDTSHHHGHVQINDAISSIDTVLVEFISPPQHALIIWKQAAIQKCLPFGLLEMSANLVAMVESFENDTAADVCDVDSVGLRLE